MTIAVTLEPPLGAPLRRRAGLRQALGAEWAKVASLRSTGWALLATVVGTLLVCAYSTHSATHHTAGWYQGFDPTNQSMAGLALGSLVMGILGIMVITGEYGTGTIRSSLAVMPRRSVLLSAKVIVVGLLALVVGEVLSFGSYALGWAVLSGGGAPTATLGQPGVLRAVTESGAYLALIALFALGIGTVIRHTAGSIAAFVGATLLLPILLQHGNGSPGRFTPEIIYANSVASVSPQPGALSATVGFLLMSAYSVAAIWLGAVLLARRDA
jgi:ABC-2 type transport system permease protein